MLKGLSGGQTGRGERAGVHSWRWDGGSSSQSPSEAAAENWEGRLCWKGLGKGPCYSSLFVYLREGGGGGNSPLLIN